MIQNYMLSKRLKWLASGLNNCFSSKICDLKWLLNAWTYSQAADPSKNIRWEIRGNIKYRKGFSCISYDDWLFILCTWRAWLVGYFSQSWISLWQLRYCGVNNLSFLLHFLQQRSDDSFLKVWMPGHSNNCIMSSQWNKNNLIRGQEAGFAL